VAYLITAQANAEPSFSMKVLLKV